jgi:O-antigen/teichoic acid export membrane protein
MGMKKSWLRKLFGAATDQALLSLANLAVSLAFIRFGSKTEYGLYVLLLTPIYLAQGLQNALFLSPYVTRVAGGHSDNKFASISFLVWGQVIFLALIALLSGGGLYSYFLFSGEGSNFKVVFAVSFGIVGALLREAVRSFQYSSGNVAGALKGNFLYSTVLFVFLGWCLVDKQISLIGAFGAMGIGGVLALLMRGFSAVPALNLSAEMRHFWMLGRWAVIGVVLTWVNSNFYPFVLAREYGLDVVGEVNAARLFWMPLVLVLPAWSNLFRPIFSKSFAEKNTVEIRRLLRQSTLLGGAGLILFGLSVSVFYPYIGWVLGKSYEGIGPLIGVWCFYYLFFFLRTVFQAVLMVDQAGYRYLSNISMVMFVCLWPLLFIGAMYGPLGVVFALGVLECLQWLCVRKQALRYLNI